MSTSTSPLPPVAVVDIPRELVIGNRTAFKEQLLDHAFAGEDVLLNFAAAGYLDSSGLGVLVGVARRLREHGRQLVAFGLDGDLRELFTVTHLDQIIPIALDEAAARHVLATCPR